MKFRRIATALSLVLLARAAPAADRLDVAVDKGRMLRLDTNAKIVLVAEPGIADAVVESPRLIFILGRRPGETNLFILDARDRIIHEADVVVHADGPRLVSVHRGTREATLSCAPRCASVATPGASRSRGAAAARSPRTPSTSGASRSTSPAASSAPPASASSPGAVSAIP